MMVKLTIKSICLRIFRYLWIACFGGLLLSACGGSGGKSNPQNAPNSSQITISALGYWPKSILANSIATLDGQFDFKNPGGKSLTLKVTDLDGSELTFPLNNSNTITEGYVPLSKQIGPLVTGTYTFTVWVIDSSGKASNKLIGKIDVTNGKPISDPGRNFVGETGLLQTLDGTNSSDPNHDPLTYTWHIISKPADSATLLQGENSSTATFVPDTDGVYEFGLTVFDGLEHSTVSQIKVTSIKNGFFTIGSNKNDVLLIHGNPTKILDIVSHQRWEYGHDEIYGNPKAYIDISKDYGTVVGWDNRDASLKTLMVPGNNITEAMFISLGSHKDDVIKIQGTPGRIERSINRERWVYGFSTYGLPTTHVDFSTTSERVILWDNRDGVLILE